MRIKASYRLSQITIDKLKRLSAYRKKTNKDPSQGKIIDELVAAAGLHEMSIKLTKSGQRRLKQLSRKHGLPPEKIVDLLINTSEFELELKHTFDIP